MRSSGPEDNGDAVYTSVRDLTTDSSSVDDDDTIDSEANLSGYPNIARKLRYRRLHVDERETGVGGIS